MYFYSMKATISVLTITLLMVFSATGGVLIGVFSTVNSPSTTPFSIDSSEVYGVNEYTLIEVDEGDNDEEEVVITKLHEFSFESINPGKVVIWDFDDGNSATGTSVSHSYQESGHYTVTATSTTSDEINLATIMIMVEKIGYVESDNMECVCAPTAKSTVIDLVAPEGIVNYEGLVSVIHDGSSESCTLRNPFQECHLRVIIEYTNDGIVSERDIIFDDTFRTNQKNIAFQIIDLESESGEGVQIRLETDQLRDWHKPTTTWSMTAPLQN